MSTNNQNTWLNISKLKSDLSEFFEVNKAPLAIFGSTVNQTFEAFVFASVAAWYRERGWQVELVHPAGHDNQSLRLKFSTRGRPSNFSFIRCTKNNQAIQIRHQIRLSTKHHKEKNRYPANIVADVAVIQDIDTANYSTDHAVPNNQIISFGEAKHMSAFAELVANFLGLVHEIQPDRLRKCRYKNGKKEKSIHLDHIPPFLFASGFLFRTALGIKETIKNRGYDVEVFYRTEQMTGIIKTDYSPPDGNSKTKFTAINPVVV